MIRRGDRRPFYAPAKYVIELTPDEVEALRRKHNATNAHAQKSGSPRNSLALRQSQQQQLTTFSATSQPPNKVNNSKRSSYSPLGSKGNADMPILANSRFKVSQPYVCTGGVGSCVPLTKILFIPSQKILFFLCSKKETKIFFFFFTPLWPT